MKITPRLQSRDWPLSIKVMLALALTLLTPGVVAVAVALQNYNSVAARGLVRGMTPIQLLGIVAPILMWLAALAIGWIIANRLIVRPLTSMRSAVEAYRRGDKQVRLRNRRFFSREIEALADAFDALADDTDSHEAELNTALNEQKRLTREVHHRVKNNLQIVSSLLSIQAREATSAEVSHAYAVVQARVAALAIVHRWMYESDSPGGGQSVDLKALATDLAAGLEQSLAISEHVVVRVVANVEQLFVGQDTAVPLAFLITELVSVAARNATPDQLDVSIQAYARNSVATLTIATRAFIGNDPMMLGGTDPNSRIVHGMARQLRSPLVHDAVAGSYAIDFSLPAAGSA